jgi:putative flippase GtrA
MWKKEGARFLRFGIVTGLAYGIYIVLYVLLARTIWPQGSHTIHVIIATLIGDLFNFIANRQWAFQARDGSMAHQFGKFFLVVGSSFLLQTGLFYLATHAWPRHDLVFALVLPLLRAMYNYLFHRAYTFRRAV